MSTRKNTPRVSSGENTARSAANNAPARRGRVIRLASGAGIVGAAAAVAAAALIAGPGTALQSVPTPATAVPAGAYTAVCPEPMKLLEAAVSGVDSEFSPESETARSVVTAAVLGGPSGVVASGSLAELGAPDSGIGLAAPEGAADEPEPSPGAAGADLRAAVLAEEEVETTTVLRAQPLPTQAPPAGAVLAYTAQDGDLRGLAGAQCQRPANDFWLLGANTTVGHTAVLTISNVSTTPATVDLELYGAEGPIEAPGSRGILVAPGQSEQIILAGLASDQSQLAVRLRSSGGPVTAFIQQSVLRDLTPGGVEYVSASAGSTEQVISGVVIQPKDIAETISGQDGYAAASPALQVAVPGTSDAVLEVRVFGPSGPAALPDGGVRSLPAGTVQEISLAGLPEGTYTIEIRSDVPVAAAARISRGLEAEDAVDFAFSPGSDPLGSQHVVAVPHGVQPDLAFGAPQDEAVLTVRRIFADGQVSAAGTVTVPGGSTARISAAELGGGDSATVGYLLGASGGAVYGAQILTSGPESSDISVLSLPEAVTGQQKLPIVLGY